MQRRRATKRPNLIACAIARRQKNELDRRPRRVENMLAILSTDNRRASADGAQLLSGTSQTEFDTRSPRGKLMRQRLLATSITGAIVRRCADTTEINTALLPRDKASRRIERQRGKVCRIHR